MEEADWKSKNKMGESPDGKLKIK